MKELEFIKYISKKFSAKGKSASGGKARPVIKGIGDDCAILQYTKNKHMLLTCDMIIEGTHFSGKATPFQIGWKAVAVNISDIASMGGIPRYALVSAGIPRNRGTKFLKGITKGVETISRKFNILVIGGDTNTSRKIVINVTLIGEVEKNCVITRNGARRGDLIFVTGCLGEGRVKHLKFLPRLKEARILAKNFKLNSMIDLSDGLAMDLNRLAQASKVGACVYKSLIPLSDASEALDKAIFAGEDFELLFTASIRESKKLIKRMGRKEDLPITLIGEIVDRRFGVQLIEEEGKIRPLKPKGFIQL